MQKKDINFKAKEGMFKVIFEDGLDDEFREGGEHRDIEIAKKEAKAACRTMEFARVYDDKGKPVFKTSRGCS